MIKCGLQKEHLREWYGKIESKEIEKIYPNTDQ